MSEAEAAQVSGRERGDDAIAEQTCDVLIVGGGPSGLLLAGLLAQQGIEVVVLEGLQEPSTHSRAIGLHPPAVNALQELGLDSEALRRGRPIVGGAARSRGRDLGTLTFERAWPARPYVLALPQSRTEDLLARRLEALAPGALHRGRTVHGMREIGGEVRVWARVSATADDDGADHGGDVTRWRARMVVGADGARSTVRDLAGIGTQLRTYPDTYVMGDFADRTADGALDGDDDGAADADTATIHLAPAGVVESFPLPQQQRRWVVHTGSVTVAGRIDATALAALVRARTGERIDPSSNTMISPFTVRRRTAERMVSGRCVLIGDAAHEVSPIGGQGITLGWLDAAGLAPLLAQVVAQDQAAPLPTVPGFGPFERDRRRAARAAGRLAHLNMALGRPVPVPVGLVRDWALRAALVTPLKHRMAAAYSMARA